MPEILLHDQYPFPDYIDSTMHKDLSGCDYLYYIAWIRRLKAKGQNIHLHFGGCYALGLEIFRKSFYGSDLSYQESFKNMCNAVILEWNDFITPEYPASGNLKTLEACLIALKSYFEEYPPGEDVIKPFMTDEGPAVEFNFAIPIPNTIHPTTGNPILYTGRFDMLGVYGKALFIDDEKTTGSLGPSWAKQWKLSGQITGYIWAGCKYDFNIKGAIIRGVSILKASNGHMMVIEQRPQWMIDEWLEKLVYDVNRAIKNWENNTWIKALDNSCNNYGGCKMMDLCVNQDPEPWIESGFEHNSWNPLDKD